MPHRGFHNVPVLRCQPSKLPLAFGKSAFKVLATGRENTYVLHREKCDAREESRDPLSRVFLSRREFHERSMWTRETPYAKRICQKQCFC